MPASWHVIIGLPALPTLIRREMNNEPFETKPWREPWTESEEYTTYELAIQRMDVITRVGYAREKWHKGNRTFTRVFWPPASLLFIAVEGYECEEPNAYGPSGSGDSAKPS